jgi:hypothetical protein
VVGIHKGTDKIGNWNLGSLIKDPIIEFFKLQKIKKDELDSEIIKYQTRALIDKLGGEENKKIGFDFSLIQKREFLFVNLIHFDINMKNKERFEQYNKFKVDVVGAYFGIDDLVMFVQYLEALKNEKIPFIVLSTGYSGKDVIAICQKYSFIKEVIIFCEDYNKYKDYITKYPCYVKKIFVDIKQVYDYIKSFGPKKDKQEIKEFEKSDNFIFSYDDIERNNPLGLCPVISAYEYDNFYFLIHRAYAHFFQNLKDRKAIPFFSEHYFNIIKEFINESDFLDNEVKMDLIRRFEFLIRRISFVEDALRFCYTGETMFLYIMNRIMRNFEKGFISLAFFFGPFLFGLNKYVYENAENFSFKENMTLYRNILCSSLDLYLYYMNVNHIICFPSFSSTSIVRNRYFLTKSGRKYSGFQKKINNKNECNVTIIFRYIHQKDNISPGIIIKDNKGKDGQYISRHLNENEVLLFPFTFARITKINKIDEIKYEMFLDIINKKSYTEYALRDDVEKMIKFNNLD